MHFNVQNTCDAQCVFFTNTQFVFLITHVMRVCFCICTYTCDMLVFSTYAHHMGCMCIFLYILYAFLVLVKHGIRVCIVIHAQHMGYVRIFEYILHMFLVLIKHGIRVCLVIRAHTYIHTYIHTTHGVAHVTINMRT